MIGNFPSQAHREQSKQPFPWQIPLLTVQALVVLLLVVLWAVRLIRKGNVLFKRKKEENCADSQGFQDENETGELLRLARALVASKLTYDDKQEQEITERLTEFLDKEYKNNVDIIPGVTILPTHLHTIVNHLQINTMNI